MKKSRKKTVDRFRTSLLCGFLLLTPVTGLAASGGGFPESSRVASDILQTQRGGFKLANGLELNLAVQVHTWTSLAGGTTYSFHSATGPVSSRGDLSNVLQVGPRGSNEIKNSFHHFNGIVNLVQNTADNVAIRQLMQVDVQLVNLTALKNRLAPWRMPQQLIGF